MQGLGFQLEYYVLKQIAVIITNKSNPMLSLGNIHMVLIQIHADVPNFYMGAGDPLSL